MPSFARTHDISSVNFHMRDLETFGQIVTCATDAAFPNENPGEGSRYNEVHVLFLSWEDDPLGVSTEIAELRDVFRQAYHYGTEDWHIPSNRSHNSLVKRITDFLEAYEDRKNLLIVYYAGHGRLNDDRQLVGACHATTNSPTMNWLGIQNMLEQAESDVLILLDCCAGASSTSETGNGVTEVIAACGFETWAPGISAHSFTRSLIDELHFWCGNASNSVAMLHMRVLATMKHWKPRSSRTSIDERRKTPVHSLLTNQGNSRSIQLSPLSLEPPLLAELPVSPAGKPFSESSDSQNRSPRVEDGNDIDSSQSSTSHVWSDRNFRAPKVLISLALEEDQWLSPNAWAEWLERIPAKVKSACVEGVYRSYSTLVLLSIPVATWDMLPDNPSVNFIAFVRSENLLQNAPLKRLLIPRSIVNQAQTVPMSTESPSVEVSKSEGMELQGFPLWLSQPREPMLPDRQTSGPGKARHNLDDDDEVIVVKSDVRMDAPSSGDFGSSKASMKSTSKPHWYNSTIANSLYSSDASVAVARTKRSLPPSNTHISSSSRDDGRSKGNDTRYMAESTVKDSEPQDNLAYYRNSGPI